MNELALFAGAGGGILGGKLMGWRTICAVERDAYAASVLAQRQNDGHLDPFPIWSDVKSFDGTPWRGLVDVVSGGFPCQDISCAGKGAGIGGERSGLWAQMARIIGEVRPRYVFVENSSELVGRGLTTVISDLTEMGFDSRWGCFTACSTGAPHMRSRLFLVANTNSIGSKAGMGHWYRETAYNRALALWGDSDEEREGGYFSVRMETESMFLGVAYGLADRVDRLRAIGNGQVPAVAALAWETLK